MRSSRRRDGILAALLACGVAPPAFAQGGAETVEEIIVTGSRIPRQDFLSASPIVTVDSEAFRHTASSSVEAVLARMPQFVPEFGSTSNNPGQGGIATVQLRGLGAQSTLVLVDGKRLIPSNGNGAVDVNIIPPALLERVEVISGGASAVYGSDAVAGVVNFKLKQSFDGVQLDGTWGQTDREDGEEQSIGITAGSSFAEGRGQVFGYLGHSERDGVTQAEREFSAYTLDYVGPGAGVAGPDGGFVPVGSPIIPEGLLVRLFATRAAVDTLFERYGYAPGTVPYSPFSTAFSTNADGTLFTLGNGSPGSVVNYRGERDPVQYSDRLYSFNYAPWNYLQLPLERSSAVGRASFELASGQEVYAQLLYADYSSDTALAHASTNPGARLSVPRTNPYLPADFLPLLDSRPDPNAEAIFGKRFLEIGPREASNEYDVYQTTLGIRGSLRGSWSWEAYAQHGDNDQRQRQDGLFLRSKVLELLRAPDGGRSICGEFDVFRIGGVSPECAAYIRSSGSNSSGYEQSVFEVSATGPVWTLPAGEIELALGLMHKRDEYFYHSDPAAAVFLPDLGPDLVGFNPADDVEGDDHNTDVYIEAAIPLLASQDSVSLEALLGYRRAQYASAGGADAWKAELLYQPAEPLRLRGSLQRAVRAPGVFELYQPRLPYTTFAAEGFDPCNADSPERTGPDAASVAALCLAQGVPADQLASFQGFGEVAGSSGGNDALEPETANTLTVGFVLSPAFGHAAFEQLQIAVDWFEVEVDDAIEFIDFFTYLPACYDPVSNPAMSPDAYWCGFFGRDATTGLLQDFRDTNVNYGRKTVSGIDTQLDWRIPAGPGSVALNAVASWLERFEYEPPHGLPPDEITGLAGARIGSSQPEWKLNLRLAYEWSVASAGIQWRYIDAMQDADVEGMGWDFRVPAQDYLDAFLDAGFDAGALEGLSVRAGVENLTDEEPPIYPSAYAANTDPSQYDVLGRRYYINLSYRF